MSRATILRSLSGAALLAVGRRAGIERFGDTTQSFLASLAPLVAFPLVGTAALLISGSGTEAAAPLLLTLVAQLAPAVLSHALAVRWGVEPAWLRYATAFNWCQWAIPLAAFLLLLLAQTAADSVMSDEAASGLLLVGLAAYGLWLHWILARFGLGLKRGRAALLVFLVNAGTVVLVVGPRLLQSFVNAPGANGSGS